MHPWIKYPCISNSQSPDQFRNTAKGPPVFQVMGSPLLWLSELNTQNLKYDQQLLGSLGREREPVTES